MRLNKKILENLEKLARLDLSAEEQEEMLKDLSKILDFVDKLNEIDTNHIEPLIHPHTTSNIYRNDISLNVDIKKEILENAPSKNSDYLKVPKVVSQ